MSLGESHGTTGDALGVKCQTLLGQHPSRKEKTRQSGARDLP